MKQASKILWIVCGLSLVILFAVRFILGGWMDWMFGFLGVGVLSFIAAVIFDGKLILEFLTMKTTKHGMNMGVMIILALALMVSVNFLAVRHDKTIDLTEEKLLSLSDQSEKVLDELKDELTIRVFYRGEEDKRYKQQMQGALTKYQDTSNQVKVRYINSYVEQGLAQQYLKTSDRTVTFVEFAGRRIRVEANSWEEEKITSAIIKATRKGSKRVYVLSGHGEKSIDSDDLDGLGEFRQALMDQSFTVESLNLLQEGKIPSDADVVAVIGPQTQLQQGEIDALLNYTKNGGALLVAADPGPQTNIQKLVGELGVEFKDNILLNDQLRLVGAGIAAAMGLFFDGAHEITKKFRSGENFTLFNVASEVVAKEQIPKNVTTTELVKTLPTSFSSQGLANIEKPSSRRQYSMALAVTGELSDKADTDDKKDDGKEEKTKASQFSAVVFGDSDFLSNEGLVQGLNRDLALNTIAYLVKEADLISIRPKQPKGTKLELTSTKRNAIVLSGMGLPILFLIMGGFVWYRRRNA